MLVCVAVLIGMFLARSASGQVLTTAETIGSGKSVAFVSDSGIFVDGVSLNIVSAQYIHGLTGRFDLYVVAGQTRIFGEGQVWVGAGGNLGLGEWRGVKFSTLNITSVPLNRRQEASMALLNSALLASRNVTKSLALYGGVNSLWPIGMAGRGVFTPTEKEINIPVGVAVSRGVWVFLGEVDLGHLRAVGIALARSF